MYRFAGLGNPSPTMPAPRARFLSKNLRLLDMLTGAGSVAANVSRKRWNASSLAINLSQTAPSVAVNLSRKLR
ncbi:hypothetical protein ALQ75_200218 [Pseudomonas savastanoi pv. glycinea]|nr:hypothetical protein ALQ87_200143 [Pseudomonas savastanoi pv. glycinea]RMM62891.1 hypothetical protein ALQ75_200218 [Pseudomonas savastanoi pv. glycinea]